VKNFLDTYRSKTSVRKSFFKRAKEVMPGGISHNIHFFPPYLSSLRKQRALKSGTRNGNEYVDFWMGNYTHILGHRPRVVVQSIEKQLKEGIHWGMVYEKQIEWAELIRELSPVQRWSDSVALEQRRRCMRQTCPCLYRKENDLKDCRGLAWSQSRSFLRIKTPMKGKRVLGWCPSSSNTQRQFPSTTSPVHSRSSMKMKKIWQESFLSPSLVKGLHPAKKEYLRCFGQKRRNWVVS